ncbi:hypothetical protein M153_3890001679 [Pseudoloma neurophilia]|uniref:Uncharacterized protein n=1 Tax=Pseudoloma neurophilia TaxID=146866 RepID=A0A0R0M3A7_9MICR|nr:hypothetical protein M153_3890001679 [Pseudoloma neurophilia]
MGAMTNIDRCYKLFDVFLLNLCVRRMSYSLVVCIYQSMDMEAQQSVLNDDLL